MKRAFALGLLFVGASAAWADEALQECRVIVGKEWIILGSTSQAGCFKFAQDAATPGQWQYAKHGETYLKVMDHQQFASADGGNTWAPVAEAGNVSVDSLNRLNDEVAVRGATAARAAAAPAPVVEEPAGVQQPATVEEAGAAQGGAQPPQEPVPVASEYLQVGPPGEPARYAPAEAFPQSDAGGASYRERLARRQQGTIAPRTASSTAGAAPR